MGLLSFLFKQKYTSKKTFPVLCFKLGNYLESIRKNWIQGCKNIMEEQAGKSLDNILVDEGPIDTASKAFQIMTVTEFVSEKAYVHPCETKIFSGLIDAEVFGDALMECLECVKMYEKYKHISQLNHQISKDMAQCFLGRTASEEEIAQIMPTVDIFTELIQMVTADVFSDYRTVKKKERAVQKQIVKLTPRARIEYAVLENMG